MTHHSYSHYPITVSLQQAYQPHPSHNPLSHIPVSPSEVAHLSHIPAYPISATSRSATSQPWLLCSLPSTGLINTSAAQNSTWHLHCVCVLPSDGDAKVLINHSQTGAYWTNVSACQHKSKACWKRKTWANVKDPILIQSIHTCRESRWQK